MIAPLVPRILALPADIRDALARVDGPGWQVVAATRTAHVFTNYASVPHNFGPPAWFSANPAASVAAVLGIAPCDAHQLLADHNIGYDHAAALSIIEAHVANRGPHV